MEDNRAVHHFEPLTAWEREPLGRVPATKSPKLLLAAALLAQGGLLYMTSPETRAHTTSLAREIVSIGHQPHKKLPESTQGPDERKQPRPLRPAQDRHILL